MIVSRSAGTLSGLQPVRGQSPAESGRVLALSPSSDECRNERLLQRWSERNLICGYIARWRSSFDVHTVC